MLYWDLTITLAIVAVAGCYVAFNIYKAIKDAASGGCSSCCSSCSHCKFAAQTTQAPPLLKSCSVAPRHKNYSLAK
jgi:hypothetical protein